MSWKGPPRRERSPARIGPPEGRLSGRLESPAQPPSYRPVERVKLQPEQVGPVGPEPDARALPLVDQRLTRENRI